MKRLKRCQHEGVLDTMQARLDRLPGAMVLRRQTVEHVFGTLKSWSSSAHLLTRTLEKVRTEMSLSVLVYNIKRMIRLLGVQPLIEAIRTNYRASPAVPDQPLYPAKRVLTQPRPTSVNRLWHPCKA